MSHLLLEEMLRTDCENTSGKGGCFLARRKGSKPKKRQGQETQSTIRLEGKLAFSVDPWWAFKATVGWWVPFSFPSKDVRLSRLGKRGRQRDEKEPCLKKYWIGIKCKTSTRQAFFLSIPSSLEIYVALTSRWVNLVHWQVYGSLFACFLTPGKEDGICPIEQWSGLKRSVGFLALPSLARIVTVSGFLFQRNSTYVLCWLMWLSSLAKMCPRSTWKDHASRQAT